MTNRFLPDTLRSQILAGFFVLFLLTALPLTWYLIDTAQDEITEQRERAFRQQVNVLAAALAAALDGDEETEPAEAIAALAETSNYTLALYEDGNLIASALGGDHLPPAGYPPMTLDPAGPVLDFRGDEALAMATVPVAGSVRLVAATDADAIRSGFRDLWIAASLGAVLAIAVFAMAGWFLSRRLAAPLVSLRDQALAVAAGDINSFESIEGTRAIRDLASVITVMSDRVRMLNAESEDARRRLEMIFEHLREGVLVVDSAEVVIAENPMAREILGNQEHSGIGLTFAVVVRDHDLLDHMRSTFTRMGPSTIPVDYARSGRSVEATAIPIEGDRRNFCVVVLRDVTEFRRLELVRREFVANVSHELRTPLASIRALTDTLESGAIDDRTVAIDFLQRILGEVDRLTALVEELLDLARLESGRVNLVRRPARSEDVLQAGVVRLGPLIERAGLTLNTSFGPSLPVIDVDQQRIEQVVINLLHNAVKFTPPGGSITVTATDSQHGLRVDVSDTGYGIPEEELSRVFERFYKADRSRRTEGTGLGLAISKHIVKAHNGELWATSSVGEGSTFSFWIPSQEVPAGDAAERLAIGNLSAD